MSYKITSREGLNASPKQFDPMALAKRPSLHLPRSETCSQRRIRSNTLGRKAPATPVVRRSNNVFTIHEKSRSKRIPTMLSPNRKPTLQSRPVSRPSKPSDSSRTQKPATEPRVAKSFLLASEEQIYGNRCPHGYLKKELLGKGGCAVVWSAIRGSERVALKQIPKSEKAAHDAGKKEVQLHSIIERFASDCKIFSKAVEVIDDRQDLWIAFELGGPNVGKSTFEIKGEFCRGERVYKVNQLPLYQQFVNDVSLIKKLLTSMLEGIQVLSSIRVVHSDLKPDNILYQHGKFMLIDFGSAFRFDNAGTPQLTTPEYAPPEVLSGSSEVLSEIAQPWSYDVWSLGMIFLELIAGFPIWLSLKSRINGRGKFLTGLMAVQGREKEKLFRQQEIIIANLPAAIKSCGGGSKLAKNEEAMDLLAKMLEMNPLHRIKPYDALAHPFLCNTE